MTNTTASRRSHCPRDLDLLARKHFFNGLLVAPTVPAILLVVHGRDGLLLVLVLFALMVTAAWVSATRARPPIFLLLLAGTLSYLSVRYFQWDLANQFHEESRLLLPMCFNGVVAVLTLGLGLGAAFRPGDGSLHLGAHGVFYYWLIGIAFPWG